MTSTTEFAPLLLNIKQVAALLGCHPNTIWNRVRDNKMPQPTRWEGKTLWRRRDIEQFVEDLVA